MVIQKKTTARRVRTRLRVDHQGRGRKKCKTPLVRPTQGKRGRIKKDSRKEQEVSGKEVWPKKKKKKEYGRRKHGPCLMEAGAMAETKGGRNVCMGILCWDEGVSNDTIGKERRKERRKGEIYARTRKDTREGAASEGEHVPGMHTAGACRHSHDVVL
jgi:hypothetical protein